jgi:hypothetical protein
MSKRQKMTSQEVRAILYEIWGPPPNPKPEIWGLPPPKPKPKVVTSDGEAVRDATVKVSEADPNYKKSDEGVVQVRREDWVTVNMQAYEEQQWLKAEDRRHRREIDPCRLGHWDRD